MKQLKLIQFLFLILLSGIGNMTFAQEKEIVKILNRELKREVKNQAKSQYFNGDTITIIKEFSIDENKNLILQIKRSSPYIVGTQFIHQTVPLSKILKIGKDMQIILETERDAVTSKITYLEDPKKEQIIKESLYFLYLSSEKNNENLGIELQKAFEKAGYKITKEYWYD